MRFTWKHGLGLALATAGALILSGYGSSAASTTVQAGPGSLRRQLLGRAAVEAARGIADVRALAEGRVIRVEVEEGQEVEAGTLLAEIESTERAAEVARLSAEKRSLESFTDGLKTGARREERRSLEAELRAAEAEHAFASDQLGRVEGLARSNAAASQDLDRQRLALSVGEARVRAIEARLAAAHLGARSSERTAANARVEAADAALRRAEAELSHTMLVSPIHGVVVARRIDPGDTLRAIEGGPAFEIADLGQLRVRLEFEEQLASQLSAGAPITLRVEGQETVAAHGRISRLGAKLERRQIGAHDSRERADGLVRTAWGDVQWSGDFPSVALGQRFDVWVELPPRQARVRVPHAAVQHANGRSFVQVPARIGFDDVEVQFVAEDADWIEVDGLPAGTSVRVPSPAPSALPAQATAASTTP